MDEETLQLALEMLKMPNGTHHPGAMKVIEGVFHLFGAKGVQTLNDKTNGFIDIWDKFVNADENVDMMYAQL